METPNRATIEVYITESGGFGDVSAGINIAESLSRDYNILITFESVFAKEKYIRIANDRFSFKTADAYNPNDAIARVVPFMDSSVKHLPKKPTIVISQFNGEPYLCGYADYTILSGLGIEEDGRYRRLNPTHAIRSGLYIKEISLEDKISRTDICSKLNKTLSRKVRESEEVTRIYKELAGQSLDDSGWITSYNGTLSINGIFYDALADAVSKSESFAQKKPVVLNFVDEDEFRKYIVPACERKGFNIIYANKLRELKVINRKSPVTVINFGYVNDELYEQAVNEADLMNVSAGDGSFTKGFSAFMKTGTPFLKYYNRDQREFMKGLVGILRDIEKEEGLSPVSSDFFETFTALEHVYKKSTSEGLDTAIKCRQDLPIDNVSRLFYDGQARQEFCKTASKILKKIKQRRKAEGIEATEVLPNALDTTKYIITQITQGKTREEIFQALTGRILVEEPKTKKDIKSSILNICKDFMDSCGDLLDFFTIKKYDSDLKYYKRKLLQTRL